LKATGKETREGLWRKAVETAEKNGDAKVFIESKCRVAAPTKGRVDAGYRV
jgi:hypothetical protein